MTLKAYSLHTVDIALYTSDNNIALVTIVIHLEYYYGVATLRAT